MNRQTEGNGEGTAASQGMGSPPPRRDGWVRVPGDRGTLFRVALAAAALLVVGGLGPWVSCLTWKKDGNIAILNFSEISGFTGVYDPPEVIGAIRTR